MRIVQTVFGVFHHFELARELARREHLQRVYSTWPWRRLQREGLPKSYVQTFPWLHLAEYAMGRSPIRIPWIEDTLGYSNALAFDAWTLANLQRTPLPPQALIGISGSSLRAGAWVQQKGGVFICDRGSTHQRYQQQILADEFARWGLRRPVSDERDTLREEEIYAQADAITVPSSAALRSFLLMGIPAAKLHRIPYGVRLEAFRPTAEPAPNRFDVLFAGAPGLRKGVPYLLQAFEKLLHPRKTLTVAGYLQEDLKPILSSLPTQHVTFLGPIPRSELVDRMSQSHVLVLPSIEEGLALVQAEAMACGCPVIASTNTGAEDLFTDGDEGYIVPIRNVDALRNRMQHMADHPALARQMRQAAMRRVQRIGGWSEYGDRWERLLLSLTAKTGHPD